MNVLLLEYEMLICRHYERMVRSLGFECTACMDAATALKVYRRSFHPFIIHALRLPDMDGLEFCCRIRSMPRGERSLIMVVSAISTSDTIQAAFDAGVNEYLLKPVREEQFKERLMTLVKRYNRLMCPPFVKGAAENEHDQPSRGNDKDDA